MLLMRSPALPSGNNASRTRRPHAEVFACVRPLVSSVVPRFGAPGFPTTLAPTVWGACTPPWPWNHCRFLPHRQSAALMPGKKLQRAEPQEHDAQADPQQLDAMNRHPVSEPAIREIESAPPVRSKQRILSLGSAGARRQSPLSPGTATTAGMGGDGVADDRLRPARRNGQPASATDRSTKGSLALLNQSWQCPARCLHGEPDRSRGRSKPRHHRLIAASVLASAA
jgi:hypothetical protein